MSACLHDYIFDQIKKDAQLNLLSETAPVFGALLRICLQIASAADTNDNNCLRETCNFIFELSDKKVHN